MKLEKIPEAKKAAIVSLGARISLNATNVRSVDLMYMRDYIMKVLGRSEVDFVSKKTRKEANIDYFKDTNEVDLNDYDEIYIYNAPLNLFGGVFEDKVLTLFEKLYDFNGNIYYLLADPKMPPVDFSEFVKSRDKNKNYTLKCDNKAINNQHYIKPEILDNWTEKVHNRIIIAYCGQDYDKYRAQCKKELREADWFNFWLFEYYAVNEDLENKLLNYKKDPYVCDLVYFGNNRQNERNKVIKKFYDDKEISKFFIGFDPDLDNTIIEGYVKHDELFKLLGQKGLATLVVGDILHNGNVRTPRFFEAMLLDIAAFICIDFDPEKKYIKNEWLKDFIYVSTPQELKEKVQMIKNDKALYKKVVELERLEIIDQFGYMKEK